MNLVYTITSGYIKCNEETCEIPFALVFLDNGIYKVETFLKESSFYEKHRHDFNFTLIGKTEKDYDIEIYGLDYLIYRALNDKVEFICRKYIKISNNKSPWEEEKETEALNEEDLIWFVELEGMKTRFADNTTLKNIRYTYEDKHPALNLEFDHTSCMLIINHSDFVKNNYNIIFSKSKVNDNIIIDFTHQNGNSSFEFKNYLKIKKELLSFISFANGGEVFVRKELTGKYYIEKRLDAQIVYHYSRKQLLEYYCDDYLPINEHHSTSKSIFSDLFINCFDKYFELNKTLDFNALVSSINNTNHTNGLEERYFILITALEKICSNYLKTYKQKNQTLIEKSKFDNEIKPKLLETLKLFESEIKEINPTSYESLKSKLSAINNVQNINQRMFDFLEFAKIPLSDEVKSLVSKERHLAVHEGIIGKTPTERVENYWKLDNILRDCILNLIGYKRDRKRKVYYYDKAEMLKRQAEYAAQMDAIFKSHSKNNIEKQ